ncbi:MAG: DUF4142 domain-containing protein [Acidobacteria bacterium]|nr:DUF4142 domain-containing protein [Acidobacteriota bacterium]
MTMLVIAIAAPALGQSPRGGGPSTPPEGSGYPGAAPAAENPSGMGDLAATDRSFVMAAARGGLAEVELGKLAASKATDPDVKSFGQRMVDDHSKANDKLRQVASQKGVPIPSDLDRKTRSELDRLAKLSGSEFDRTYVKMMVKDHVKDVAEFNREATRAHDSQVRQFVSETLPIIQDHLKMAKDLESKVGLSSASRSH